MIFFVLVLSYNNDFYFLIYQLQYRSQFYRNNKSVIKRNAKNIVSF